MKKLLLSGGVIIIFLAYAWKMQQETAGVQVVAPTVPSAAPTSAPAASGSTPPPTQGPAAKPQGQYKDGSYTGDPVDAAGHGLMQVTAVISGGKLVDVRFVQTPSNGGTSVYINSQATPYFKQEALAAQSANVDIVSGATESTMAFQQSLASALSQAKI